MLRSISTAFCAAFVLLAFAAGCSGSGAPATPGVSAGASSTSTSTRNGKSALHRAGVEPVSPTPFPTGPALYTHNFATDAVGSAPTGWATPSGHWLICQVAGGPAEYCQTTTPSSTAMQPTATWTDYQVDALLFDSDFSTGGAAILGRMVNATQYYQLELKKDPTSGLPSWLIAKSNGSAWTELAIGALQASPTSYYRLRLAFSGSQISAWIVYGTGTQFTYLGSAIDSQFTAGTVGFRTFTMTSARFDNIAVTSGSGSLSSTGTTETPQSADSLVDSVGVNVDLPNMLTSDVSTMASLTQQLGVRHVRVALLESNPHYNGIATQFLTSSGTRALGSTDCAPPLGYYPQALILASDIQTFQITVGGRLEAYEAVNEPDTRASTDPNWVADTISCMQAQAGALPGIPFVAPPLANPLAAATQLGNISGLINEGSLHRYFSGFNPGTAGWGGTGPCGVYGALPWAECEAAINSGSKPIWITESGYNSQTEVDEPTQAKYISRLLFVNSRAGVPRTYIYCMRSYTGADGFGGTGILETNMAPKPAYRAVQNELALFADPGAFTTPSSLTYGISGGPATLQHELFKKRSGSYILALWNETESWQPNGGGEIVVPPTAITVSLPFVPLVGSAQSLNDAGNLQPTAVTLAGESITLPVDDHMTFITFK